MIWVKSLEKIPFYLSDAIINRVITDIEVNDIQREFPKSPFMFFKGIDCTWMLHVNDLIQFIRNNRIDNFLKLTK